MAVARKSINTHLGLLVFGLVLIGNLKGCLCLGEDTFIHRPSIYLSLNPLNHKVDINWFNLPLSLTLSASIVVTSDPRNPHEADYENILYEVTVNSTDGRERTHLRHNFTDIDEETECYGMWYFLIVDGNTTLSGCKRAYPNWMSSMKDTLKDKRIRQLFIPGTHDSASYKRSHDPNTMENIVTKFSLTQDDDIKSQLLHGIRYLDLRIGYYRSNAEKFWANHGISRLQPLSDVIKQIKDFIDVTDEIIIVDFQEFPIGFKNSQEVHQQLVFYLFQELGSYAADPRNGWDTTLGDIWRAGQRVIIAYDHFGIASENSERHLFHSVRQRWGKVKSGFERLEKFLREQRANMSKEPIFNSRPFAEMAELTPEAIDVFTNGDGLRKLADSVNWKVTKLYHGDFGRGANVVPVDFHLATNIVEIAIEWNRHKYGGGKGQGDF